MQPGDRIGQYTLIEMIGQGGQAAVWSAEDQQLRRIVAIKTINIKIPLQAASGSASAGSKPPAIEEQVERFRLEARIVADLEHPFILPVYGFGEQGDWIYIVMRYMPGGTLKNLIAEHPLSVAETLKLAEPLAEALDLAHARGIIHRDIKSVNILLDAQHRPYLADFGLSATVGDTKNTTASGTLAYMAPEQLKKDSFDHRSDLYSFGLLLFEMLVGNTPRHNSQHWNLMQMMNGTELPVPFEVPQYAADVLRRLTDADPDQRYDTAMAAIAELKAGLEPVQESIATDAILLPITDPAMQASIEAFQLFDAALVKWADGAGRFRLYEEDFIYLDSFYAEDAAWGFELDESGQRLMLRGALEHGHNLAHWWGKLADPLDQRAVALQTLSSELPEARLRAIEQLTKVEDAVPPAIPIRVATIISTDPDPAVKRAGINLLVARSGMKSRQPWREVAYSPTIDGILADLATDDPDPSVNKAAARAIAQIGSSTAAAKVGQKSLATATEVAARARESLLDMRDQAPTLPASVPSAIRTRAFVGLSLRQLLTGGIIGRIIGATLGFGVGWGILQFAAYQQATGGVADDINTLVRQAINNSISTAVPYGLLMVLPLIAAIEPARRLRAWQPWGRALLALVLATPLAMLAFYVIRNLYYFTPEAPEWPYLAIASALLMSGFAIGAAFTRMAWLLSLLAAVPAFGAFWLAHYWYTEQTTYESVLVRLIPDSEIALAVLLAVSLAILSYGPEWIGGIWRRLKGQRQA